MLGNQKLGTSIDFLLVGSVSHILRAVFCVHFFCYFRKLISIDNNYRIIDCPFCKLNHGCRYNRELNKIFWRQICKYKMNRNIKKSIGINFLESTPTTSQTPSCTINSKNFIDLFELRSNLLNANKLTIL